MADLSKLSESDLEAISRGDLSKVSEAGLATLAGEQQATPKTLLGVKEGEVSWRNPTGRTLDEALKGGTLSDDMEGQRKLIMNAILGTSDMAAEGGGATAGSVVGGILGARVGAPTIGAAVGRSVGGVAGNALGQMRRILSGEQDGFRGGESVGAAIGNAVPGGRQAAAGVGTLLKEVGENMASNVAATNAQSLIDRGELAGLGENALAAAAPAVLSTAGYFGRGKSSRPATASEMTDRERFLAENNQTIRAMREVAVPNKDGSVSRVVVDPASLKNDEDTVLKSLAGKEALAQEASVRNSRVFQGGVREQLGLGAAAEPFRPLRDADGRFKGWVELETIRDDAAKPYQQIAQNRAMAQTKLEAINAKISSPAGASMLVFDAKAGKWVPEPKLQKEIDRLNTIAAADVDELKLTRKRAVDEYKKFKAGDPAAYDKWQQELNKIDEMEKAIDDAAAAVGKPGLPDQLKNARKRIAETYVVESSINPGNGLVDPADLARILDARPGYLTGNLEKIARFRMAMPKDAVEFSRIGDPNSNAMTAGLMTGAGLQNPKTAILGQGVPLVRQWARNKLLSDELQGAMIGQRLERMKEGLAQEAMRRTLMAGSR